MSYPLKFRNWMIQLGFRFERSKFTQSTKNIIFYGFVEKFIIENM